MFPETIETDRLRLEPRWPENVDLDDCYRICASDPGIDEVTEYVTWDPHETKKETLEFLERGRERWEDNEAASYVIRPREGEDGAGEIAGFGGFSVDWRNGPQSSARGSESGSGAAATPVSAPRRSLKSPLRTSISISSPLATSPKTRSHSGRSRSTSTDSAAAERGCYGITSPISTAASTTRSGTRSRRRSGARRLSSRKTGENDRDGDRVAERVQCLSSPTQQTLTTAETTPGTCLSPTNRTERAELSAVRRLAPSRTFSAIWSCT